jgi:hypothetical protein
MVSCEECGINGHGQFKDSTQQRVRKKQCENTQLGRPMFQLKFKVNTYQIQVTFLLYKFGQSLERQRSNIHHKQQQPNLNKSLSSLALSNRYHKRHSHPDYS